MRTSPAAAKCRAARVFSFSRAPLPRRALSRMQSMAVSLDVANRRRRSRANVRPLEDWRTCGWFTHVAGDIRSANGVSTDLSAPTAPRRFVARNVGERNDPWQRSLPCGKPSKQARLGRLPDPCRHRLRLTRRVASSALARCVGLDDAHQGFHVKPNVNRNARHPRHASADHAADRGLHPAPASCNLVRTLVA